MLSGVVSTGSGEAVAGATVTLVGLNLTATTNAGGAYAFSASGTFNSAPIVSSKQVVAFSGGTLLITLAAPVPLSIELFDMSGRLLDRIADRSPPAGTYRFNMAQHKYSGKTVLLRVSIGNKTSVLRCVPSMTGLLGGHSASTVSGEGEVLAKIQAVVDTIRVTASGYLPAVVTIESYEGKKNISLVSDPDLEKFSFFVTSMEGLQTLAGSEDGFGGDLRFGKTGPGAGLLGADSICACLAEMSMEGSSSKKWSAFLSATKGPDSNKVNAIDRIGNGPWYDRMGRLVANNKEELLNDRPIDADEAIINDLPNEYGIPNHRPDPTKSVVDNHMTVTGSNSQGKLYADGDDKSGGTKSGVSGTSEYGYTCDDWTSTTVRAKPRVGMSWPQGAGGFSKASMGGGMKNWISAMNASGCEAGIDLKSSTGAGLPGVYTIGNGGGYGGFYCFAHKP
jgi:hypothetical protein